MLGKKVEQQWFIDDSGVVDFVDLVCSGVNYQIVY